MKKTKSKKPPMIKSKPMQEILDCLGPDYTTKTIDRELCVYRGLGNGFDIEISGTVYRGKRVRVCKFICVWWQERRSVEYVREVKTLPQLKQILSALVEKYGNTETQDPEKYVSRYADEFLEDLKCGKA